MLKTCFPNPTIFEIHINYIYPIEFYGMEKINNKTIPT